MVGIEDVELGEGKGGFMEGEDDGFGNLGLGVGCVVFGIFSIG